MPKLEKAETERQSNSKGKVVKVSAETHAKLADMAKWGESMDEVIQRLTLQAKGLEDVVAGQSSICYIDGHEGRLLYRGYDIEDLAAKSTYEETSYLLLNGRLPTLSELRQFTDDLVSKRPVPPEVFTILRTLPRNCDAMDALRVGMSSLGIFDDPMYSSHEKSMSIASKVATITAATHRLKHGLDVLVPREDLGYAANFLYMLTGKEPSLQDSKIMDTILILHADHELNASTFTARVIASTLSDVYSAITGAIGALKGPLHGGANEKVVEMVQEIGSPDVAEEYVKTKLAQKQKINGFGHRVYKTMDPRARILKGMEEHFVTSEGEKKYFEILRRIEVVLKTEKGLYPNVDLYSGLALNHIGVESYLFTPTFAVGRAPGWLAHVLEQYADNRIIRPRAEYIGPQRMEYVPIEKRSEGPVKKR
ncbi:MAG TPA: citrate/2-methylcitrate synthase [Nitrososphaerales archaeon]|nr:citrate/2-methylcitrate synthase [Nitrososphaerales archaeon]